MITLHTGCARCHNRSWTDARRTQGSEPAGLERLSTSVGAIVGCPNCAVDVTASHSASLAGSGVLVGLSAADGAPAQPGDFTDARHAAGWHRLEAAVRDVPQEPWSLMWPIAACGDPHAVGGMWSGRE